MALKREYRSRSPCIHTDISRQSRSQCSNLKPDLTSEAIWRPLWLMEVTSISLRSHCIKISTQVSVSEVVEHLIFIALVAAALKGKCHLIKTMP